MDGAFSGHGAGENCKQNCSWEIWIVEEATKRSRYLYRIMLNLYRKRGCEDVDYKNLYILYLIQNGSIYLITITVKKPTYTFILPVSTRHHKHHSSLNSTPSKIKRWDPIIPWRRDMSNERISCNNYISTSHLFV